MSDERIRARQFPPMGWSNHCATIGGEALARNSMALANAVACLDHWAWQFSRDRSDMSCFNLLEAWRHAQETFKLVTGKELPRQ